ncbi:HD domain-containing protein [Microbacterium sp. QXD-8]|uniref:HD domain-containing protein n=1 Tax=Microbacterium psychrotolerans TaxID=3068321 RepID=A0ABU0YYC5_9MICO|nr:YfbR-like 5'-deoxynucleotidase [Microbacterium sp. QXD-8]MDQ7877339.1 HD domain-containing protein [Microbacterium sp. QXD-8]
MQDSLSRTEGHVRHHLFEIESPFQDEGQWPFGQGHSLDCPCDVMVAEKRRRADWHRGDWMQTFTGRQFYPMDPRPDEVDITDIAHSLAMQCRYNGHVRRFYSVAEHCVLMSQVIEPEFALWALLHDATEAYVGDMVRPLKLNMPEYRAAEDRVEEAIAERFGLPVPMPARVKEIDTAILLNERLELLSEPPRPWSTDGEMLAVEIVGWSPAVAKWEYLARFAEITTKVDVVA